MLHTSPESTKLDYVFSIFKYGINEYFAKIKFRHFFYEIFNTIMNY